MVKLYIREYVVMPQQTGMGLPIGQEPGVDQTPVAIGAGSLQSAAFATATRFVRIHADAICSIEFGSNPTATANSMRFAAGQTEYFGVKNSDATPLKVAVITNT
jgi:hypothetical protein